MRYFIPVLFLFFALLAFQTWMSHSGQANPTQEAMTFLTDIQSGNLTRVVRNFGGNTCRCPAHYGWGAFLAYQPGQETNLAFLLGHPFSIEGATCKKVESPPQAKFAGPFEQPEDYVVDVQIAFDPKKYSPFFLPLPMAYGKSMTWQELQDFIRDPAHDAVKGFSLRLRPGLTPGAIKFDTSTIAGSVLGEFKFLRPDFSKNGKNDLKNKDRDYNQNIKTILTDSLKNTDNQFVTPQDAGVVIMADGSKLPADKLAEILPRLISTGIRLHVVRRGKFQPWTIFHFVLRKPIIEENNGIRLIPLHN